jgi:glycosyltransferase involved in cell wall biosynthesis
MSTPVSDGQLHRPLVSIIINNYNYGRFLREAIESALRQTWVNTEVIVVDDGSEDDSADIIRSYGTSIVPVLKENGGQGSSFNAGFAASRGEIVCFLDADDVFLPGKAERLVQAWIDCPDAGLIYHQLLFIDRNGQPRRGRWPSFMLHGWLKDRVQSSGGWWPHPTTSGLTCSRDYLERILPMPTPPYKLCADAYVGGLAPFLTKVVGIREPLALYRQHGMNNHSNPITNETRARRQMNHYELEFRQLQIALRNRSVTGPALSLDHHYPYQWCKWKADAAASMWKLFSTILRTPSMPLAMRFKALWNTGVNSRLT